MVSPYDEMADTRPRIRRDVLYTQTPTGVHFHNARGGFSVVMPSAYRFATLIVPHLTGDNTVAALCQGLGDKQREMVVRLVGTLYARGFARDAAPAPAGAQQPEPAVAERFGAQIDYVDHYTDGAADRFQRFRGSRVAVLGDDALARWAALSLVRNGCAAVAVPRGIDSPANRFAEIAQEAQALRDEGCPVSLGWLDTAPDGDPRSDGDPRADSGPTPGGDAAPDAGGAPDTYGWAQLDGFDVVLVTGDRGPRQIARLLAEGVPAGRRLLPAWTFGESVVIGPLMTRDATGCWTCAVLRLGANGAAGAAADVWSAVAPAGPREAASRAIGGPLAAMVGNLLGYEVFRLTTGVLPAETQNQLVIQDLDSLDTTAEPLLPHPRCPRCGTAADPAPVPAGPPVELAALDAASDALPAPAGQSAGGTADPAAEQAGRAAAAPVPAGPPVEPVPMDAPLDAAPDLAGQPADGPAEEDAAQAALAEITDRAVLVHPNAGVFRSFADETWAQTPLKVSTVTLGTGHRTRREITAFDVHHVAGARLRALYRAAEVYVEHVVPAPQPLGGAELEAARQKWDAVDPAGLSIAGGLGEPAELIPQWCAATSLLGGETLLVPAAAVRPFGPHNRDRIAEATSAGTGAGGSAAEAVSRGLRTAFAHDTLRRALGAAVTVSRSDLGDESRADLGDAELTFLVRSAAGLGVPLEILDLGGAGERALPVVLARAADPATGRSRWAVGSALRWRDAALEAVRDLLGAVQADREPASAGPLDTGDPLLSELDPATLAVTGESRADLSAATDWSAVAAWSRDHGRDILLAPSVTPDLAAARIHTTRVLLTTAPHHAH